MSDSSINSLDDGQQEAQQKDSDSDGEDGQPITGFTGQNMP